MGLGLKEAMESDRVNPKDTEYWFTEPPGESQEAHIISQFWPNSRGLE